MPGRLFAMGAMHKAQLEIMGDAEELAARAVGLFVSAASEAVSLRGVFRTAFSGGRTPEAFFRRLAQSEQGRSGTLNAMYRVAEPSLPWDKVHVFWVDERYVPPDSPASNYRLAVEALLSRVEIPSANTHRIATEDPDPAAAARAYERTIREAFANDKHPVPAFDLILLGLGQDGHTASLFPASEAVRGLDALVCAVHVAGAAPPDRITLTPRILRAARRLVVLISGREKASILKEVLASEPDEARYPIHVLWPVLERVTWLVDRDAAGELGGA